jgi:hypothetical protein
MDTKQIKVKLPDGTNFQMSAFSQGNNEEYLIHVIAINRLLEQKGIVQDIGKAFTVVFEVRKQMELLLKATEGETKTEEDEQVTVRQCMSCMGVLNDYLAYLPTVYDSSMAKGCTGDFPARKSK